jgi:hypothetical protein
MKEIRPREVVSTVCGLAALTLFVFRLAACEIFVDPQALMKQFLLITIVMGACGTVCVVTQGRSLVLTIMFSLFVPLAALDFKGHVASAAVIFAPALTLTATAHVISLSGLRIQRAVLTQVVLSILCVLGWIFIFSWVTILIGFVCATVCICLECSDIPSSESKPS